MTRPGNKRSAKLTPEQVVEMRRLYSEENWTQGRCARKFGISVGQVGRIVRGEHWVEFARPPTDQEIAARTPSASEAEVEASQARLADLLVPGASEAPASDPIEEILRRRSGGEDPLARFRSGGEAPEANPTPEESKE